ncbi:MAG: hypothetical protein COA79_20270 [Planctomycetota bacterium]|nr:MAG: hypothetical protein COA79_20270 [Planctomycetota bacterium]
MGNGLVIIDSLETPDIHRVVWNHLHNSPGWELTFFHGTKNGDYVKSKLSDFQVTYMELPFDSFPTPIYNEILTSPGFWQAVPYDKVLMFHPDSEILRGGIDKFMEFDYVGAPWTFQEHGGNGGFSLRSTEVMRDIVARYKWTPEDGNEDCWFCNIMHRDNIGKLAPRPICEEFACESIYKLGTFGYHAIDKYLSKTECEAIRIQYADEKVFLLTYPRSGTNWVRYIIEQIYPKNPYDTNFIHFHEITEDVLQDYHKYKMVFCLRNYREAILRNARIWKPVPEYDTSELTIDVLLEINEDKKQSDPGATICNYMQNLKIFDQWPGYKHLVRYEELITKPNGAITDLAWALHQFPGEFLLHYERHREVSIGSYNNSQGSYTMGESVRFHQDLMPEKDRLQLDIILEAINPYLYEKYLKQYAS